MAGTSFRRNICSCIHGRCRYEGFLYKGNLIIAAHNYAGHFGKIKNFMPGDAVLFTDADGNVFEYVIGWMETIKGNDSISMLEGEEEWDLTLFTCNYSGSDRYTVRCIRQD
ncbi:MAG: sortase [Schaedlerella sp.]|nr:sortase [Schaedlerella sp.]